MKTFEYIATDGISCDTMTIEAESFTVEYGVLGFWDFVKVGTARKHYLKLALPSGYWAGLREVV